MNSLPQRNNIVLSWSWGSRSGSALLLLLFAALIPAISSADSISAAQWSESHTLDHKDMHCGNEWLRNVHGIYLVVPIVTELKTSVVHDNLHVVIKNIGPGSCDPRNLSIWVAVDGPESMAQIATPDPQACSWSARFTFTLPGKYKLLMQLLFWDGRADFDNSKCEFEAGAGKTWEYDAALLHPAAAGAAAGGRHKGGSETNRDHPPMFAFRHAKRNENELATAFCCERCTREPGCSHFIASLEPSPLPRLAYPNSSKIVNGTLQNFPNKLLTTFCVLLNNSTGLVLGRKPSPRGKTTAGVNRNQPAHEYLGSLHGVLTNNQNSCIRNPEATSVIKGTPAVSFQVLIGSVEENRRRKKELMLLAAQCAAGFVATAQPLDPTMRGLPAKHPGYVIICKQQDGDAWGCPKGTVQTVDGVPPFCKKVKHDTKELRRRDATEEGDVAHEKERPMIHNEGRRQGVVHLVDHAAIMGVPYDQANEMHKSPDRLCKMDAVKQLPHDGRWLNIAKVLAEKRNKVPLTETLQQPQTFCYSPTQSKEGQPAYTRMDSSTNPSYRLPIDFIGYVHGDRRRSVGQKLSQDEHEAANGSSQPYYYWQPYSCDYHHFSTKELRSCLVRKKMTNFIVGGDALMMGGGTGFVTTFRELLGNVRNETTFPEDHLLGSGSPPDAIFRFAGLLSSNHQRTKKTDLKKQFTWAGECPHVVVMNFWLNHKLWLLNETEMKAAVNDEAFESEKVMAMLVEEKGCQMLPKKLYLTPVTMVSERQIHLTTGRSQMIADWMRETFVPRGWVELNYQRIATARLFDSTCADDGLQPSHNIRANLAQALANYLCFG